MKTVTLFSIIILTLTAQTWAGDSSIPKTAKIQTISIKSSQTVEANHPTDLNSGSSLVIKPYQANSLIQFDPTDFKIEPSSDPDFANITVTAKLTKTNLSVLYKNTYILSDSPEKADFSLLVNIPKKTNIAVVVLTIVDLDGNIKIEKFWIKKLN